MTRKFMPPVSTGGVRTPESWSSSFFVDGSFSGRIGLRGAGGQIAQAKHLLDGGNAGDRLLAELADAVGERSQQLVADVDGAAAHAFDNAGEFGFGALKLGENHVLAGTARAAQDAEDFNGHGLGLGALKNSPGRGHQAAMNLAEGENAVGRGWWAVGLVRCRGGRLSGWSGRGLSRNRALRRKQRDRGANRNGEAGQAGQAPGFLQGSFHVYKTTASGAPLPLILKTRADCVQRLDCWTEMRPKRSTGSVWHQIPAGAKALAVLGSLMYGLNRVREDSLAWSIVRIGTWCE